MPSREKALLPAGRPRAGHQFSLGPGVLSLAGKLVWILYLSFPKYGWVSSKKQQPHWGDLAQLLGRWHWARQETQSHH